MDSIILWFLLVLVMVLYVLIYFPAFKIENKSVKPETFV